MEVVSWIQKPFLEKKKKPGLHTLFVRGYYSHRKIFFFKKKRVLHINPSFLKDTEYGHIFEEFASICDIHECTC